MLGMPDLLSFAMENSGVQIVRMRCQSIAIEFEESTDTHEIQQEQEIE